MSDSHDIGLVFVHGAGLGGWIWEVMGPGLDFPYLFTDFPGREGAENATQGLRLGDYGRHLGAEVDEFPSDRLAIVAHSLGGAGAGDVREIASGHMPMLSQPDQLTRVVNEFAAAEASAEAG